MAVFRHNEIELFGVRFPILGLIKVTLPSQWANKQVIGDYTKDSERFVSSLTFSDQRRGIGIKDMKEATDFDRCDWSTCEIGFRSHIVLPALATDCGNPTATYNSPLVMVEFQNTLYVCFTTKVYSWTEASTTWSALLKTLSGTPSSACVHKSKMYVAVGTDFERFDGALWTTGLVLSGGAVPCKFIFEWEAKLCVIDANGNLSYSTDEGVTWTANAAPAFEAGYVTDWQLAPDPSGETVPYLGTKQGTYYLDFASSKWIEAAPRFTEHEYGSMGMAYWRDGYLYVSAGLAVHRLAPASSPVEVTTIGPDRDNGVPAEYRGHFIALINEQNNLLGLLTAATEQADDLFPCSPLGEADTFDDEAGYSAIMKWNGAGWSVEWTSGGTDAPITCGLVGTPDSEYRLWFGADRKVFYIPLSRDIQNPIVVSSSTYAATGQHVYPVFDADNAVVNKMALSITVSVEGTSATEYITLEYQLEETGSWVTMTSTAFPDGKIDIDGESKFMFGAGLGVNFKRIQIRANLVRGATVTATPDLRWLRLDYMKLTENRWQYQFVIDCTRDYRHQRAATLEEALKAIPENMTLGQLVYRTYQGTTETVNVRLLASEGYEPTGKFKEGQYRVTLLAP